MNKFLFKISSLFLLLIFALSLIVLLPQKSNAIAGGQEAAPNQFPFAVRTFGCGGVLISSQWVVSAAHCYDGYYNASDNTLGFTIDVNVGGHYDSGRDGAQYQVVNAYRAPSVNGADLDIMLLKLSQPVFFSDTVQPIAYNNDPRFGETGTATLMGWGSDCFDCPPSQVLRYYSTQINGRSGLGYLSFGSESNTTNGVCPQDSGSPAVKMNENGRYILLGTHSDSYCTNEVSWVGDVALVADWIYSVTGVAGNANAGENIAPSQPSTTSTETTQNTQQGCVIPDSGPWPPCATGADSRPPNRDGCIIPSSGPWPACAR